MLEENKIQTFSSNSSDSVDGLYDVPALVEFIF